MDHSKIGDIGTTTSLGGTRRFSTTSHDNNSMISEDNSLLLLLRCLENKEDSNHDGKSMGHTGNMATHRSHASVDSSNYHLSKHVHTDDVRKDLELDRTYHDIVLNSMKFTTEHHKNRGVQDENVADWQDYCVHTSVKEKLGPKVALPVVVSKNTAMSDRATRAQRSRRWGGGQLVMLPGAEEEEEINGPSSYLQVFKKSSKLHLTAKR